MRYAALVALLAVCGCARGAVSEADVAAVYDVFLDIPGQEYGGKVLLQNSTIPMTVGAFGDGSPASRQEVSSFFSAEVREAIRDLVARGRTPVRLPEELQVSTSQTRISPDSVRRMSDRMGAGELRQLPDSTSIVQFSAVGFNRDRTVAVVVQAEICGAMCGGSVARVIRRHPGGWLPAEELFFTIS